MTAPADSMALLVAFYYFGLLIFGLLGLVWLGYRQEVIKHRRVVERVNNLMIRQIKIRGRLR